VELLVAIVLLGIISGAIYQVLVNNQRTYQAQTQQIDLQQNLRAAVAILPAEFRELNAVDGDINALSATSITIRAMRKLGFLCVPPPLPAGLGNIPFVIRAQPMFGRNLPFAVNDSVLVFFQGNAMSRTDDVWLPAQVKTADAAVCTDGTAGFVVQMAPQWLNGSQNVAGAISGGSPIRAFETVRYRVYQALPDTNWYLGYESVHSSAGSATIQPLVGPLNGSAGMELDYFDSTGVVTTDSSKVALIEIHLRAKTAQPVRSGGPQGPLANKVDSITTRVALRNNPRCGPGSAPFTIC